MRLRDLWPLAWAGTVRDLERRLIDALVDSRKQRSLAEKAKQEAADAEARSLVAIDHYRQVAKQWRWVMELERAIAEGRPAPKLSEIEPPSEAPHSDALVEALREQAARFPDAM